LGNAKKWCYQINQNSLLKYSLSTHTAAKENCPVQSIKIPNDQPPKPGENMVSLLQIIASTSYPQQNSRHPNFLFHHSIFLLPIIHICGLLSLSLTGTTYNFWSKKARSQSNEP